MLRRTFIEQVRRQIYGGLPPDDAEITEGLVNTWLESAIGVAAKTNSSDNQKLDSVAYVSGSFYLTYKALSISKDEEGLWKITLPQIPLGLGADEGVNTVQVKDGTGRLSQPILWLTQQQRGYARNLRKAPNRLYGYLEGKAVYLLTSLLLDSYTASVAMVSGGLSTDLDAELIVPADYHPAMIEYLKGQLMFERNAPKDVTNDGIDMTTTKTV